MLPGQRASAGQEAGCEDNVAPCDGRPWAGVSMSASWVTLTILLKDVIIRGTWVWGTEGWFVFSLIVACESIMISK